MYSEKLGYSVIHACSAFYDRSNRLSERRPTPCKPAPPTRSTGTPRSVPTESSRGRVRHAVRGATEASKVPCEMDLHRIEESVDDSIRERDSGEEVRMKVDEDAVGRGGDSSIASSKESFSAQSWAAVISRVSIRPPRAC